MSRAAALGDGITSGTTLTTSNTGRKSGVPFDTVSIGAGAGLSADNTHAFLGSAAIKIATGSTGVNVFGLWTNLYRPASGAAQVAVCWVYFTALPAATVTLFQVSDATPTKMLDVRVSASGVLRLFDAANAIVLSTANTIAVNQWVRIELYFTPAASSGTAQFKLYNNASSSTPTETTATVTGQNFHAAQVANTYLGVLNSIANSTYWAQFAIGDAGAPPFGAGWSLSSWVGAVTDTQASVSARVLAASSVRLKVSTTPDLLTSPVFSGAQTPDSDGTIRATVTGLTAATPYYYGLEVDGTVDTALNGQFRTFPPAGVAASFGFAAASCATNNSDSVTFDAIRTRVGADGKTALFFQHLGDLHYRDIITNDQGLYHKAYDQVMSSPRQALFYRSQATPYTWSDHDSVGPNGDGTTPSLPAAQAAYRSRVPSYTLQVTDGIYHSYSVGRVLFVVTDGRSFMSPIANTDDSSKTKLGATQKTWLKTQFASGAPLIIWFHEDAISDGPPYVGDDTWSAYNTERTELLGYIRAVGANVAYINGDLHCVACDSGVNVPGVAASPRGFPVHVAAPMDQTSYLGLGTYSGGVFPASNNVQANQYGWFDVSDTGQQIALRFTGYDSAGVVRVSQSTTWGSGMAKQSGLGDNYYVAGNDLSGDTNSLSKISGGPALLDVTSIIESGFERIGGLRDGGIDWVSYFNPTGAHPVLSALPTTDVVCTYCRGTAIGNPAACLVAKQIDYNPTRAADGMLTAAVSAQANGYGLEWGVQLTAGLRTDTAATNGTSWDFGTANSFGFQAYLQLTAFTGTDITVKLQDSADNVTFADLASGAFTQVVAANQAQRIAVGGTATIRRYVRASTVTTGGFTSATFNVVVVPNTVAVAF